MFWEIFWQIVKKKKKITKIRTQKNLLSHGSAVQTPIKVVQCQLRFLSFSSSNKSWTKWPSFDDFIIDKIEEQYFLQGNTRPYLTIRPYIDIPSLVNKMLTQLCVVKLVFLK